MYLSPAQSAEEYPSPLSCNIKSFSNKQKNNGMKSIFILLVAALNLPKGFTQNIGIGTATPTRAKLELHGTVGTTSAIFGGESSGISLQTNWPSVGFNQYYNAGSKYIGNGFAAVQYVDPNNGGMYFDMFPNGAANTNMPTPVTALRLTSSGNVLVGSTFSNASLSVSRNMGAASTATFFGTQYHSHINSTATEHTYIRGGRNNAEVFINDIPGGNIIMGAGTNKVGINVPFPIAQLHVNGTVAFQPVQVTVSAGNTLINVGSNAYISIRYLGGNGILGLSLTNGIAPGQLLILVAELANQFEDIRFAEGPNADFAGTGGAGLEDNDTLVLVWNGTKWTQLCHSKNS